MCDPNRVEFSESCELFFELFLLNFISQVSDIDSCASFVAHANIFYSNCWLFFDNLFDSRRFSKIVPVRRVVLMLVCVEIDDLTVNL